MTDERKYGDEEVSEIFDRATSDDSEGLTLGQLQEVGEEVGLHPERVAAAAASLESRTGVLPRKTWGGAPVGVGRIDPLPRAATDREWNVLVGELRETFRAQGRIATRGESREWTNGNLHAFVEPTADGYRLRMGTQKGGSKETTIMGSIAFVVGFVLLVTSGLDAATFGTTFESLLPALMAVGGGGTVAYNVMRLRHWAEKREHQMEHIAGRARALVSGPPPAE